VAQYLIGIDEAGRGPLAGPVSVGAVLLLPQFDRTALAGVKDSKQLSEEAREAWYAKMRLWQKEGHLRFAVAYSSARQIDSRGIVWAVSSALRRALRSLEADPAESLVLLDGGLRAPVLYEQQETIIRGDATEPVIALASIAAKVRRDRLMKRLARAYPAYGFEVHKGYGTKAHRDAVLDLGPCAIHRRSFCGSLTGDFG
jgi:ribonuclease HII